MAEADPTELKQSSREVSVRSVWCAWTLAPEMVSSFTGRARCHPKLRRTGGPEWWGMAERNYTLEAGFGTELEIGSRRKLRTSVSGFF